MKRPLELLQEFLVHKLHGMRCLHQEESPLWGGKGFETATAHSPSSFRKAGVSMFTFEQALEDALEKGYREGIQD
jgi:hypothetical protein